MPYQNDAKSTFFTFAVSEVKCNIGQACKAHSRVVWSEKLNSRRSECNWSRREVLSVPVTNKGNQKRKLTDAPQSGNIEVILLSCWAWTVYSRPSDILSSPQFMLNDRLKTSYSPNLAPPCFNLSETVYYKKWGMLPELLLALSWNRKNGGTIEKRHSHQHSKKFSVSQEQKTSSKINLNFRCVLTSILFYFVLKVYFFPQKFRVIERVVNHGLKSSEKQIQLTE